MKKSIKLNNHQKGILLILLSALLFGINSIATKSVPDIPAFQRIFFMNGIAAIIMYFRITDQAKAEILQNKKLLAIRSTLGFVSTLTYFFAITKLPLADATLLNKTSPFFVTFFSVIWLKEKVSTTEIFAMLIAGFGAVLVINPSFNLSILPALIGVLSGATAGGAYTIVRNLNTKVNPNNIVFFFMLFSCVISLPFMLFEGFIVPSLYELIILVVLGVAISFGQIALSYAYKFEEASKISIYAFSQIIISLIFGFLLFSETPTWNTLLGGVIIFASGYMNYRINLNRQAVVASAQS